MAVFCWQEQSLHAVCSRRQAEICPPRKVELRPPVAADVEEWSWIERRNNAIMVNSSRHSLQELAGLAKERRRGVCPGACVFRDRDQLWIPLTEVRSSRKLPVKMRKDSKWQFSTTSHSSSVPQGEHVYTGMIPPGALAQGLAAAL